MLEGQFGKYRIEGVAGIGGMSVVYHAFDETANRVVALKVLNTQRSADEIALRRFEREAQIAQRLKHPHIITIYEAGEIGDRAYLAMEYLPEGSLARRFAKPVAMTLGAAAVLLGEIASALDYAHSNGVVHRDLKLENVLINDEGHLVLSDFGIAHMLDVSSLTETGESFGTALYVSPEQVHGAKNPDYRTDLYSLGVIAYLLATGYFPFSGNSAIAILHRHLTQEPPLPSNLNPRLPPQMDWLLLKGLSKHPQDRFASAGAQAEAFAAAITPIAEVEIVILVSQPTPIVSQPSSVSSKRAGAPGGGDTIPIGDLIANMPPRRSGSLTAFRVAVGLVLLALIGVTLLGLGLVLTPPPDGVATPSTTPDVALVETQATPTGTPTDAPTRTLTRTPTRTMTRVTETALPTHTARPSLTPTTPAPTATPRTMTPQALLIVASPSSSATRRATVATSVPASPAPATTAPSAAPTQAAATSNPPTNVPPTSVPPTQAPPTQPPSTQVPPTPIPPTQEPPPTATGVLDPLIPPIVPTVIGGLLGG